MRRNGHPVPDTSFHVVHHGLNSLEVAPFGKSIENVVSGLCERVYYIDAQGTEKPRCVRGCEELMPAVDRLVALIGPCSRVTGGEFLATRTGSKRKIYAQARDNLARGNHTISQLARLQFFTKFESTLWKKPQVPRIISPRTYEYGYLLGRYMRPVEHRVFEGLRALVGAEEHVIAKGLTQEEKGGLIARKLRPGWACVGLDASRFDQSVSAELLKMEHAVYNGVFRDKLLAALLAAQLHNRGVARCRDGCVRADIGPMRCSGDQNTSLGNCLISVVLARQYCAENGIHTYDLLCDGDDLLIFLPRTALPNLRPLSDWYLKWGFRMKVEQPAFVPEQVEFCQSKPVCVDGEWVLVRNPLKVLNTDFSHGPRVVTHEQFLVHLRAVGVCGMSMAGGIPVLQALYTKAIALGKTGKWDDESLGGIGYQGKIQRRAGHVGWWRPVSESTRHSFSLAFDILPAQQEMLEEQIAQSAPTCRPDSDHLDLQADWWTLLRPSA